MSTTRPIRQNQLRGCFTAISTPFLNGKVDYDSLGRLIEHQMEGGVQGIVPCGTTGESPVLTETEHHDVVEFTIRQCKNKCFVIAGTGSNSTAVAVERTRHARDAGASAALIVAPYYNKPTQEGLYRHFEAIARAIPDFPIVLYDIPGRTGVAIEVETVVRLAKFDQIAAIKEASGKLERTTQLRQATQLSILSGDDAATLPSMALGASGVISVASNLVPRDMVALTKAALEGRMDEARRIHDRLNPLFRALFLETNPSPVKFALARAGIFTSHEIRLPLVPPSERVAREIETAMVQTGLGARA